MFAVEDDWIQYEAVPARRVAVRGGGSCAQRVPVAGTRTQAPAVRAATRSVRVAAPTTVRAPRTQRDRTGRKGRLRLTRRGRLVLVVLPGLLVASGVLVALSGTPAAEAAQPAVARTVVVGTGDSLWSVARRIEPDRDPRDVVAELQAANGLAGSVVAAGAVLRLPARS